MTGPRPNSTLPTLNSLHWASQKHTHFDFLHSTCTRTHAGKQTHSQKYTMFSVRNKNTHFKNDSHMANLLHSPLWSLWWGALTLQHPQSVGGGVWRGCCYETCARRGLLFNKLREIRISSRNNF